MSNKSSILDLRDIKRNDRFIQYGLIAAKMAIEDAGIAEISDEDKLKAGVSVGSGIGGLETIYEGGQHAHYSRTRYIQNP